MNQYKYQAGCVATPNEAAETTAKEVITNKMRQIDQAIAGLDRKSDLLRWLHSAIDETPLNSTIEKELIQFLHYFY